MTSKPKTETTTSSTNRAPEILDVHGAAAFLGISRNKTYDYFQSGDLPGRIVGKSWLTTKDALLRWIETGPKNDTRPVEKTAAKRKARVRSKYAAPISPPG